MMDANMTFRIDADVKAQMAAICKELGMTTSTAFNLFANAFVRTRGMPFPIKIQEAESTPTRAQMLADTDAVLDQFAEDYRRMAE